MIYKCCVFQPANTWLRMRSRGRKQSKTFENELKNTCFSWMRLLVEMHNIQGMQKLSKISVSHISRISSILFLIIIYATVYTRV